MSTLDRIRAELEAEREERIAQAHLDYSRKMRERIAALPSEVPVVPAAAQDDALWDSERVRGFLGISEKRLKHLVDVGDLKPSPAGGRHRKFDPEAVRAYARGDGQAVGFKKRAG